LNLPFLPLAAGAPRALPAVRVFAWYEEAMRLFKRSPMMWCVLGMITFASEAGLQLIPGIGAAAGKVVAPVVECGMLIGAAALDHGAPLRLRYAFLAFASSAGTIAAVVGSGLAVFAAEAIAAYSLADVNLLATDAANAEMSNAAVFGVLTVGTLISLPFTFVPFAALLAGTPFTKSFVIAARGFALNTVPLLLFGVLALVLVALGVLTYGIGLIAVTPLLSAASYAAWKDVYGVLPRPT
jgi:hypothetical protein